MSEMGQLPGIQYYLELIIKDNKLSPINIQYLVIREWIFNILPTIEIQLIDNMGLLTEMMPLEDGEDIKVILAKHEDDENPMELTFSLSDYSVNMLGDNRRNIIAMTGYYKVPDMFTLKKRSFSRQNSARVLQTIANENKIIFSNPHNIIPADNMTWFQSDQSNFHFIKHVLRRSYVPDDVMFFYVNSLKKFVLTSLNSEIKKQEIKKSKFNVEKYSKNVKEEDDKDDTIWYSAYNIVNASGYFNKKYGYGFKYEYYDLENYQKEVYSKMNRKISQLSFRNKNLVGKIVQIYCTNDIIESNIYSEKYFESVLRNNFMKTNFFANSLVLNINALSQVYLMDKIDLYIPSLFTEGESNEVLSGEYIVAGVQHEVSNGGIYKKKLALGRNGMDKSSYIKQYQVEEL